MSEIDDTHSGRMPRARWETLMKSDDENLTQEEFEHGWHWCPDWDGLLVGPGMGELMGCQCTWVSEDIQKKIERLREAEHKLLNGCFGDL